MNVVIEENKYISKFFRSHDLFEEAIRQEILQNIENMIKNKAYKIKTVRGVRYKGRTVFEYKIVINSYVKCRVAYVIEGDTIDVFFLSTELIKAEFTKQVAGLAGVTH